MQDSPSERPTTSPATSPTTRLMLPVMAALTLGLAPFTPEPHVVGKLRWLAGGAEGMGPTDVFDLALHGAPWLWLGVTLVMVARGLVTTRSA